ncbi:MAG: hypothetical protein JXX29_19685 [Deltaproteobacteria bacterium]|nr:hypothetical protein [Deltaproteobacteria bacterium]MBN2673912.1 hypothetical protein [Deltaproteobacteria bacterium]
MKKSHLFIICVAFTLPACGPEQGSHQDDSGLSAKKTGKATTDEESSVVTTPERALPKRALQGNGITDDGKPVTLSLSARGTILSGTFTAGDISVSVSGMVDGGTIRAWLRSGRDATSFWQGNIIGTESDGVVTGTFILSDSAAQQVITGTLASGE